MSHLPLKTSVRELLDRYEVFLIDAYGVLVTSQGALPGASEFIEALKTNGRSYFILTNDGSRLPETAQSFYARHGVQVPVDRILTAGLAIQEAFRQAGLSRPRCAVLGTSDTHQYVARAGGIACPISESQEYDAIIVGDDSGFNALSTLNSVLTAVHRQITQGRKPHLFCVNPDFLYPRGNSSFGLTSGALARVLELGWAHLHPDIRPTFEVLGKPSPLLFSMALNQAGVDKSKAIMLGDQLPTDIKGANQYGIDSVLLGTGLTSFEQITLSDDSRDDPEDELLTPTYLLEGLR